MRSRHREKRQSGVNNGLYEELGDLWYSAHDNPVALLRAEGRLRNPWVADRIEQIFPGGGTHVLDVGCGGGFLSNFLAIRGLAVTGLDLSRGSLDVARRHDQTHSVIYIQGDAMNLPFPDSSFHAVCALDFLEHVDDPAAVIRDCARVLRPGGLFFFATFQRTILAWLIAIKGVEWFVKNTPPHLHQLDHFIRTRDLGRMCHSSGMTITNIQGTMPRLDRFFWHLIRRGEVDDRFSFRFTSSFAPVGYVGVAVRNVS